MLSYAQLFDIQQRAARELHLAKAYARAATIARTNKIQPVAHRPNLLNK